MRPFLAPLALAGALLLAPALARDNGQWGTSAPSVRNWYETRELNEATRIRLNVQWRSCCAHSDVVKTRFKVDRTSGGDEWWWWKTDAIGHSDWKRIPDDVVHPNEHAPSGEPTLFAVNGLETCFFPGDGGI